MSAIHPLFRADWIDALFVHFAVDPADLQPFVGMELDTFDGWSWVSLVAFTQTRLRFAAAGEMTWLTRPLSDHPFLNLRTYVCDGDECGIFFIAEWIPNRLAVLLGPAMYGLPYRLGRLRYRNRRPEGSVHCAIDARGRRLEIAGRITSADPVLAGKETLDQFLLERYTAFTIHRGIRRSFHVDHEPWTFYPAEVVLSDISLLEAALPAELGIRHPVCAHYSTGVVNVGISAPEIRKSGRRSAKLRCLSVHGVKRYVQGPC
jgi:uncharacterized protein YqjF (DUF2071 family)